MKTLSLIAAFLVAPTLVSAGATVPSPSSSMYDPTFFAGFTWTFGGQSSASSVASAGSDGSNGLGFTLKVLSTNEPNTLAGALGVTYYFDGTFGCDAGAAYNHGVSSLTLTYDFCRGEPQIGLGVIREPSSTTITSPPPS
ncbi:hypothetical protein NBRC116601_11410 [Cognatishimia sp. WU-CL00825]|uniref:hypothetical protein n=1 Tax=Cognatishimia sp. WU-CL00825 TaxID=3127658 RepID=UPI0031090B2D